MASNWARAEEQLRANIKLTSEDDEAADAYKVRQLPVSAFNGSWTRPVVHPHEEARRDPATIQAAPAIADATNSIVHWRRLAG